MQRCACCCVVSVVVFFGPPILTTEYERSAQFTNGWPPHPDNPLKHLTDTLLDGQTPLRSAIPVHYCLLIPISGSSVASGWMTRRSDATMAAKRRSDLTALRSHSCPISFVVSLHFYFSPFCKSVRSKVQSLKSFSPMAERCT